MYLCDENNMFCDYKCPDDMNIEPILHQKTFREMTTDELYELLRVRSVYSWLSRTASIRTWTGMIRSPSTCG